jgi:hypothetical protein
MAIGAEEAQVIEPVISAVAVDVIEFQWNGPAQPTCLAAHRAFGLQDSFLQQSVSELEGLEGRSVGKIHVKRLPRRQSPSPIPTLAGKMRRIQTEVRDGFSQHVVVAAEGRDLQFLQRLSHGTRRCYRAAKLCFRILSKLHATG